MRHVLLFGMNTPVYKFTLMVAVGLAWKTIDVDSYGSKERM